MKKVTVIICFLILLMFTASCASAPSEAVNNTPVPTAAEAVRNIISVGGISASLPDYRYDLELMVKEHSDFAVYGEVTQVHDGRYITMTGNESEFPCYPNTVNVEKTLYGDVEQGKPFTFDAPSGYLSYKLYLENEPLSAKYRQGETYEKYKDDPTAYMQMNTNDEPILEEGQKCIIIGQTSDFFGFGAMIQIIFENGVTVGSSFFEDGTSYETVCQMIESYRK